MNKSHVQYALQVRFEDGWKFVRHSTVYDHRDDFLWEDNLMDAASHIKYWKAHDGRIVRRHVGEWSVVE